MAGVSFRSDAEGISSLASVSTEGSYLRNGLEYFTGRGPVASIKLYVSVTDRCNMNCAHCAAKETKKDGSWPFMDPAFAGDCVGFINRECGDNVSKVELYGGEPLIHPMIHNLALSCHESFGNGRHAGSKTFGIFTNGLIFHGKTPGEIREYLERLPAVTEMTLPPDSYHMKEWKRITGSEESFYEMLFSLDEALNDLGNIRPAFTVAFPPGITDAKMQEAFSRKMRGAQAESGKSFRNIDTHYVGFHPTMAVGNGRKISGEDMAYASEFWGVDFSRCAKAVDPMPDRKLCGIEGHAIINHDGSLYVSMTDFHMKENRIGTLVKRRRKPEAAA